MKKFLRLIGLAVLASFADDLRSDCISRDIRALLDPVGITRTAEEQRVYPALEADEKEFPERI